MTIAFHIFLQPRVYLMHILTPFLIAEWEVITETGVLQQFWAQGIETKFSTFEFLLRYFFLFFITLLLESAESFALPPSFKLNKSDTIPDRTRYF